MRSETITISAESLASEIKKLTAEYGEQVNEAVRVAVKEVAQESAKKLRSTSPKKTGEYAKGWSYKVTKAGRLATEYTVYNKNKPGVTHLLEHGHGGRSPARAYVHIKPIEEKVNDEIIRKIEEVLE